MSGLTSSAWNPVISESRPNGEAYQGTPAEMTRRSSQKMVSALRSATACDSAPLKASSSVSVRALASAQWR